MPFFVVLYVLSTALNSSIPFSNRSERYSLSCVYDKKTAYIILVFVAGLSLVNDRICAVISVRDRYFFKSRRIALFRLIKMIPACYVTADT